MFRVASGSIRHTLIAAGLAVGALPMMAAGPSGDDTCGRRDRGRDRGWSWNIVIGDDYDRYPRRDDRPSRPMRCPEEEVPCALTFHAYQSGDEVIVIAVGENRGGGYTTCWRAGDLDDRRPELVLMNRPPECWCEGQRRFEIRGSFRTRRCVDEIDVIVAGECHRVRVCQVDRIG